MSASTPQGRQPSHVVVVAVWLFAAWGVALLSRYALFAPPAEGRAYVDLRVYRAGVHAWLAGDPVYAGPLGGTGLSYTYPPVSLLVLAPTTFLELATAARVGVVLDLLALVVVMVLLLRASVLPRRLVVPVAIAVAGVLTLAEPVWATMMIGQVNLLLLLATVVDLLLVPPRWRGLLVGAAAAVKLTPLVVVIYLLWRGDRRAAARALVVLLVLTLVGFVVLPAESARYWLGLASHAGRAGSSVALTNQSLLGTVSRAWGEGSAVSVMVWVVSVVVVVALLARALHRRPPTAGPAGAAGQREIVGLGLVLVAGLLVSPVSWEHHWVWALPAVVGIVGATGERAVLRAAAGLLGVGLLAWSWAWDGGVPLVPPEDPVLVATAGSTYVWLALVLLVLAALVGPRPPGHGGSTGVPS